MASRMSASKVQAKGLFTGAKVVRGRDWQWIDQDGTFNVLQFALIQLF